MSNDAREQIYHDLHQGQLSAEEQKNRHSARHILNMVQEYLQPQSVLDVGCGLGTWLSVAHNMGVDDIQGVEGPWADPRKFAIDPAKVLITDLEKPFHLNRRFDLAICLEIGEHLFAQGAPHLVESLVRHSDHILFSAAIPHQGGHHHVNEQFPDYWANLFAPHKYVPLDPFRGRLWHDASIHWWLRQNILLFVSEKALADNEKLRKERDVVRPLSLVHPDVYMSRLQMAQAQLQQFQQLVQVLSQGGTFQAQRLPDGRLNLQRIA
jgi:SAM-dependent methyltransferase